MLKLFLTQIQQAPHYIPRCLIALLNPKYTVLTTFRNPRFGTEQCTKDYLASYDWNHGLRRLCGRSAGRIETGAESEPMQQPNSNCTDAI